MQTKPSDKEIQEELIDTKNPIKLGVTNYNQQKDQKFTQITTRDVMQ